MSYVIAQQQLMAAAAADMQGIGSAINEASEAATGATTRVAAAAADEVSTAVANFFGTFARDYQALLKQATAVHAQFAQALAVAGNAYAETEAANAAAVSSAVAGSGALAPLATPKFTLVMGGSGMPIPTTSFLNAVNNLFIQITPGLTGSTPTGLNTPEEFYPLTGIKNLPLVTSVSQGVQRLDNALAPYISSGTPVGVFGYSQSAIISSLEMEHLALTNPTAQVQFVLIGDLMNPNGGIFERFAGLQLPSLGIDFYGATPSNAFPTTIYTLEYDAYADFPRYPLDILSDLNAISGGVHLDYPNLTAAQVASAVQLTNTTGATQTNYYMIPVNQLPLLDPLRSIPIIGNPLADLLQPDMTYLVNLGYGDPLYGWSTTPPNVPTQIGVLPPLSAFEKLPDLLVSGAQQGFTNFMTDISTELGSGGLPSLGSLLPSLTSASSATSGISFNPLAALSAVAADPSILAAAPTNLINTLSSVASTAYGTLLPTADIINAAVTSVPAYDVSLFLNNLSNPIDAIGLPIAADIALYMLMGSWQHAVITSAVTTIVGELSSFTL